MTEENRTPERTDQSYTPEEPVKRSGFLYNLKSPWILGALIGLACVGMLSSLSLVGGCQAGAPSSAAPTVRRRMIPRPVPNPVKAVWVARFQYRYPDDIRTIMRNCATLGLNTVFWQVRGEGTVAYPSRIEPWSSQYNYRDPGFDPLKIAVEEAHRNGLRIEAWVNVMPGWKGVKPPSVADQLWLAHPDWFLRDAAGQRQPLGDFYVILNPCQPEVRAYISCVIGEIASNYDVDGVHLDYVRYAWDSTPDARHLYPRDPATLNLYHGETGKRPDDDVAAWDNWRMSQLTRLVSQIRSVVRRSRPGASLTASVWSSPVVARRDYFQDAVYWLNAGIVDAAMPMAYTEDVSSFEGYISQYKTAAPRGRIVPGLGLYKHDDPRQVSDQLARCRSLGGDYALFSYECLHAVAGDRARNGAPANTQKLRNMRRGIVADFNGLGVRPE